MMTDNYTGTFETMKDNYHTEILAGDFQIMSY